MSKPEQTEQTGSGPLFERRYWIDVQHPRQTVEVLLQHLKSHLPEYSPDLLADFEKAEGQPGELQVGDEYRIKILGPWNGDVRVTEVGTNHFELTTLENHPEAGRIRFTLCSHSSLPNTIRFEIYSKARSRDGLVALTYDTLGIGRKVQQQTWETFCQRVADHSGGLALGPVQVETVKQDSTGHEVTHDV